MGELGEMGAWVRLHYVYPYPSVDDILPLMAEGKILPYLDIPFQHASPRILKLMKRPAHAENTLERIKKWREAVPQLEEKKKKLSKNEPRNLHLRERPHYPLKNH